MATSGAGTQRVAGVVMGRASRDRDEEVLGLREQLASLKAKHRTLQAAKDALDADLEASKHSQVTNLVN